MNTRLNGAAMALRVAIGLMAALAGLDKFFNILADWESYVAPFAASISPLTPHALMSVVGMVELTAS